MQESLKENNFVEAIGVLKVIFEKRSEVNWLELSTIWNYAIAKRDIGMVKSILTLITHNQIQLEFKEQEISMLKDSERILCSQATLKNKYGFYRSNAVHNPYELFDHYTVEYSNTKPQSKFIQTFDQPLNTKLDKMLSFNNLTHDEFKNMLLKTGQSDPQTKFFLKNQH